MLSSIKKTNVLMIVEKLKTCISVEEMVWLGQWLSILHCQKAAIHNIIRLRVLYFFVRDLIHK